MIDQIYVYEDSRINICFKYQYDYDQELKLIQNIQRLQSADAVLLANEGYGKNKPESRYYASRQGTCGKQSGTDLLDGHLCNRTGDQEFITMQRYMLEKFVSAQEDMRLCGIFCDNGETGTNFNRPDIQKMLSMAGNPIQCIIVKGFSCFGRNLIDVGDYLDQIFLFLGVRFIAMTAVTA